MKNKILTILFLIICLVPSAIACGVPQPIYGRVQNEWLGLPLPVYGATVRLTSPQGELIDTRRTNPFGYYRFEDLMPCNDYVVRAVHKSHVFLPELVLASEFKGDGVEQDLWAYQGE